MLYKMIAKSLLAGLLFFGATAHASFHVWDITEIYSSTDGSIQYIELFTSSNGQHQLSGHEITSSDGTTTFQYDFTTDLPSNATAGQHFLIATASFASQNGAVTPDYIMSDGFLFNAGGTLNFAGVDTWAHGVIPDDGTSALFRDDTTALNSPTNFAGQTGSLTAVPVPASVWLMVSALAFLVRPRR